MEERVSDQPSLVCEGLPACLVCMEYEGPSAKKHENHRGPPSSKRACMTYFDIQKAGIVGIISRLINLIDRFVHLGEGPARLLQWILSTNNTCE